MDIALNTYSLREEWKQLGKDPYKGVFSFCRDLGIHFIEILEGHVPMNLKALMQEAKKNDIAVFALAPHTHLLAKPDEVKKQIEDGKKWLQLAHDHGIKMIRVQVGDGAYPKIFQPMEDFDSEEWAGYNEQVNVALDGTDAVVSPLIEIAEKLDVKMGIETHQSYSSNYVYMKAFNKKYPSKHIGWVLDVGNFENDRMRFNAIEEIKHRVIYLHAKSYAFDDKGFEKTVDYPKICQLLHQVGFNSKWSIEFEGNLDGLTGVARTNELVKYSMAQLKGQSYQMKNQFPSADEFLKKYQKS